MLMGESMRCFEEYASSLNCGAGQVGYPWLSDHELLHFGYDGMLYRYDIGLQTDMPLPALVHQIIASNAKNYSIDASHDGKWVLWHGEDDNFFAAPIDGKKRLSWHIKGSEVEGAHWCSDSRHWLLLPGMLEIQGQSPLAHEFCVDDSRQDRTLTIPNELRFEDVIWTGSDKDVIASPIYGPHDWVHEVGAKYPLNVDIWSLSVFVSREHDTVNLPSIPQDAAVSRNGANAAWIIDADDSSRLDVGLWISTIHGTQLREIGGMNGELKNGGKNIDLWGVHWSPDGKWIDFVHDNAIWIVPVT